jgi:hypothetical protein
MFKLLLSTNQIAGILCPLNRQLTNALWVETAWIVWNQSMALLSWGTWVLKVPEHFPTTARYPALVVGSQSCRVHVWSSDELSRHWFFHCASRECKARNKDTCFFILFIFEKRIGANSTVSTKKRTQAPESPEAAFFLDCRVSQRFS